MLGLFRPPLPEPCGRLSPHTALQWPGSPDVPRDLGLSPPYSVVLVHLPPFALCAAFPRPVAGRDAGDYSGGSAAVGLAAGRRSPVPPMLDVSSAPEVARSSPRMPSLGIASRSEGPRLLGYELGGSAASPQTWCGGRGIAPLETGLRAVELSPYRAGLAGLRRTRLPPPPASPACCFPLGLSSPGRPGDPRPSLLV